MSTSPSPTSTTPQVGILVLDDNAPGGSAVKQILDSEGWRVRIVADAHMLLSELKTGEWSLVIANVAMTGVEGPAFVTLRELASVPAADGGRVRVLYLIPELGSAQYIVHLEAARLPYVLRPYHLHDFLEKVSDLLVEVKAIEGPIRQVRHEFGALRKKNWKSSVPVFSYQFAVLTFHLSLPSLWFLVFGKRYRTLVCLSALTWFNRPTRSS